MNYTVQDVEMVDPIHRFTFQSISKFKLFGIYFVQCIKMSNLSKFVIFRVWTSVSSDIGRGGGAAKNDISRYASSKVILNMFYYCIINIFVSDISTFNQWPWFKITCLYSDMIELSPYKFILILKVLNLESFLCNNIG